MSYAGKRIFAFSASIALLLFAACGKQKNGASQTEPETAGTAEHTAPALPDAAQLSKLATRAFRDAGLHDEKAGPVKILSEFGDSSYKISVMTMAGRQVSGRLYPDRRRWHIAVDKRELWSSETVIITK